jgi:hypothetical protein
MTARKVDVWNTIEMKSAYDFIQTRMPNPCNNYNSTYRTIVRPKRAISVDWVSPNEDTNVKVYLRPGLNSESEEIAITR